MSQKTREKYGIRLPVVVDTAAPAHKFDSFMIPAARKPEPVWNGLRRLWMVDGVAVDPQPAPPIDILRGDMTDAEMRARGRALAALPPSVKVSA